MSLKIISAFNDEAIVYVASFRKPGLRIERCQKEPGGPNNAGGA